ncbi:MAG: Undecaprenyl phosphate-alpha-4-amino-4-deoxy-L-arabinose arabinosyl transferase [Holosporales bacterium]
MTVHLKKYGFLYGILGIIFLLFFNLDGNRPFATPDEARYVEIPREMIADSDYITPKLNAMKYFEKPPLFYWVQAFFQKTLGASEGVMRSSVALFAFFGVLLIMFLTNVALTSTHALLAGGILSTTALYYALSRLIILDMPFTTFVTAAFVCFYMAFHHPKRRIWFYGFAAACGLGVLTKGIVILVLVGPVVLLWLLLQKENLRPFYPISATLIFLSIVVPWHYFVGKANPDFFHKYFYVEHFLRYTTSIHDRYKPAWFFIPIISAAVLPWGFVMINGAMALWKENRRLFSFLIIWSGWIFFFFSFSNSKLVPYILPVLPPLAIFGAVGADRWKQQTDETFATSSMICLLCIGTVGFILPFFAKNLFIGCESIIPSVRITSLIFIALGGGYFFKKESLTALVHSAVAALTLIIFFNFEAPVIQKTSVKPLAAYILEHKQESDAIVSFGFYFQDLPFYTQTHPVICVNAVSELEYGRDAQPHKTKEFMLDLKTFKEKYPPKSGKHFWAVMKESTYQHHKNDLKDWTIKIKAKYNEIILIHGS